MLDPFQIWTFTLHDLLIKSDTFEWYLALYAWLCFAGTTCIWCTVISLSMLMGSDLVPCPCMFRIRLRNTFGCRHFELDIIRWLSTSLSFFRYFVHGLTNLMGHTVTVNGDVVSSLSLSLPVVLCAMVRSRSDLDGIGRVPLVLESAAELYGSAKIVLSGALVSPVPTCFENSLDEFIAEATWNFDRQSL